MIGRIHSYESFGAVDGPGIRFVVFFQGCPLRCLYCHNPDTWAFSGGMETSVDEIVEKALEYRPFFRNGGGVTLSGGEPLAQHEFVTALIGALHEKNIHVAVDTAGSIPLSVCRAAVDAADLLLLDIKTFDEMQVKALTGSAETLSRERELLEYCDRVGKPVWIRHVIVPGLTLSEPRLRALGEYLQGFSCVRKIEPLAFHNLGKHKWTDGSYTLGDTPSPTAEEMECAAALLGCGKKI